MAGRHAPIRHRPTTAVRAPPRSTTISFALSLARSSRDGVTSMASIVGDRSMAMTSGAVSSTKGGASRCHVGPAAAMTAIVTTAASNHHGRMRECPVPSITSLSSRCGAMIPFHCRRISVDRDAIQAMAIGTSSANSHHGRRKWKSSIMTPSASAFPRKTRSSDNRTTECRLPRRAANGTILCAASRTGSSGPVA